MRSKLWLTLTLYVLLDTRVHSAEPDKAPAEARLVAASDPSVVIVGRFARADAGAVRLGYPGVTLRVDFEGTWLSMRAISSTPDNRVAVLVDGGEPRVVRLPQGESTTLLAEGLTPGTHSVDVVRRTETWQGLLTVRGFVLASDGRLLPPSPLPRRRMLFIGDSVTCGEGVDRPPTCIKDAAAFSNAYLSYGMLLARRFDAQCHLVCYGGRGVLRDWQGKRDVLHAPQFFDLALPEETAAATWDHAAYTPDVVFVSLGTNDFNIALGPPPEREEFVATYVRFVRAIRARYPEAQVLLTEGAIINDGDPQHPQKTVLREYLNETARRVGDARVHVIPSTHYPGDACDGHPTGAQHAAMARDLEAPIRELLGW
jgi:Carbohydrate esterase 2 N-terminal/GDSL-like Lipase/Acylhydrolase family